MLVPKLQAYTICAEALGGKYLENPLSHKDAKWLPFLNGKNTISVHPLGGCNMADDGTIGVVNHKGQVFKGLYSWLDQPQWMM